MFLVSVILTKEESALSLRACGAIQSLRVSLFCFRIQSVLFVQKVPKTLKIFHVSFWYLFQLDCLKYKNSSYWSSNSLYFFTEIFDDKYEKLANEENCRNLQKERSKKFLLYCHCNFSRIYSYRDSFFIVSSMVSRCFRISPERRRASAFFVSRPRDWR